MDLNDQIDALQWNVINAQSAQLAGLENRMALVEADLDTQVIVDVLLQNQIDALQLSLMNVNSALVLLQNELNSQGADLVNIQSSINALNIQLAGLQAQINVDLALLQDQIDDLSDRLDAEGVRVFACQRPNLSLSKERLFLINGKFYGAMNHVTTSSVTTVAGSTPVSVTVPKLCVNKNDSNNTKLPNNGGQCTPANDWEVMAGTGIVQTIPAYTTQNVVVVTSVQIALEALQSGQNYVTTDGSASCSFNGNGTNLVEIQ
jgi:hypothetical protein